MLCATLLYCSIMSVALRSALSLASLTSVLHRTLITCTHWRYIASYVIEID